MLKPRSPQASFYGSYLYDKIVPVDHLLRRINQVVDFSFVNEMVKNRYTPDFGRPAEDPEFMLRLCLLQYLYGDSDREVEENARMHNAYKYFLGLAIDEEPPDHSTLCNFRAQRLGEEEFRQVFQNVVQQCIEKGLVKGKRQIIDSTHIEANAAMNSLSGLIHLCRRDVLRQVEIQERKVAEKLGVKEIRFGQQDKYISLEVGLKNEIDKARALLDGVAEGLKQGKLHPTEKLLQPLQLLEKAVADREEGAQDRLVSTVDPDARAGKKTSKRWTGYKGHIVVEEESEIITAVETTPANQADGSQLRPLLERQERELSIKPSELSGDKGYDSGANLEYLKAKQITGNISLSVRGNNRDEDLFTKDEFVYDPVNNTVTCPAGYVATHYKRDVINRHDQHRKGICFEFPHRVCSVCELKPLCHTGDSRVHGRAIHISFYEPLFQQMKGRMGSEEGKEAYRNRYKIEHKVADLARYCGMRRCRYRGLGRAKIHTLLAAIVSNVKRMARLLCPLEDKPPEILEVAS